MSVRIMGQVWELNLPAPVKLVLLALADHADHDGTRAYPGVARIAWMTGLNRRTVQRHLADLRAAGIITPHAYATGGRGRATDYDLHPAKGDTLPPFTEGRPARKGDTDDTKGDIYDTKGRHSAAPTVLNRPEPSSSAADADARPRGTGSSAEAASRGPADPGAPPDHVRDIIPDYPDLAEAMGPGCREPGCDRGQGHKGPHRDPWWDAIVEAIYPGEGIPEHQEGLAGKLTNRARKAGHPPERILQAAAWILDTWGPTKLTLPGLVQNYERASGQLAQDADAVRARLRSTLRTRTAPARPAHQHGPWDDHFNNPQLQVCHGCGETRPRPEASP